MLFLSNSFHQFRTIQNINNNKLSGKGSMPHKDFPSDNQNTFSINRHEYLRTIPKNTNWINLNEKTKKWYGNSTNKMSSRITETKKMKEIGKSSLNINSNSKLCFTKNNDYNVLNRAIIRVRRTGGAAPPKTNLP